MIKLIVDATEVYTIGDAAQLLGVTPMTIYRWMKQSKIIPLKIGRRTLIPKSEVGRILNAQ